MKINPLKFNILLLAVAILCTTTCAYAGYDVIHAKTLKSDNAIEENTPKSSEEVQDFDPDLPDFKEESTATSWFKNKFRRRAVEKNNEIVEENVVEKAEETSSNENKQTKKEIEVSENNKFQINADKISYDDTEGNLYADGNVEIIAHAKNTTLKADSAVIDKPSQTIKLSGNVKIIRDGLEMDGQSLIVDLNEENVIMDNPTAEAYSFVIHAQESFLIANDMQMINGNITSNQKREMIFTSSRFRRYVPGAPEELYDPNAHSDLNVDKKPKSYKIDAKEIIITSYKDHNTLVFKGANIYYGKHKLYPKTDFEIIADKQSQVVETNALEVGTFRSFGTYLGYGFVGKLPKGQTLKIMPALVYGKGRVGVGLIGRHRSRNSVLEAGYSSSTRKFVARGTYRFGNGFSLRYGRNSYLPEGFLGSRRSGYAAQLNFEKAYRDEENDITFRHGTYVGLFSDYYKKGGHYFATTRFRENLELQKNFIEYKNPEQDLSLKFGVLTQGSATVYGTGDTVGIFRIGPVLSSKLKKWESQIRYMQGGIHGKSPFVFDRYVYGRSTIHFNEKFNFNNIFALGFSGAISPNKDNYKHDLITEAMIYALFGPRDFKVAVSYDFYRATGHLDFLFILGSDRAKINFEKLTTENIDSSKNKQDFYKKARKVKVEDI